MSKERWNVGNLAFETYCLHHWVQIFCPECGRPFIWYRFQSYEKKIAALDFKCGNEHIWSEKVGQK